MMRVVVLIILDLVKTDILGVVVFTRAGLCGTVEIL
jgi:hypothetical protein